MQDIEERKQLGNRLGAGVDEAGVIAALDLDPRAAGFAAVIYGHSHQPEIDYKDNVLYLNPGSIGPRRFKLPVSYAMLRINDGSLVAELIEIPK